MRSILHSLILASAVMAPAVLVTNSAMAETIKVPFNFTVAGQNWPAGVYTVEHDSTGNLVSVRSFDAAKSFQWVMGPGEPAPNDAHIVLRFDEVGTTHALRSIQYHALITPNLNRQKRQSEYASGRLSQGR